MRLEYRLKVNHKSQINLSHVVEIRKPTKKRTAESRRQFLNVLGIHSFPFRELLETLERRGNSNFPILFHRMLETYESRLAEEFLINSIGIINNGNICCIVAGDLIYSKRFVG